MVVGVQSPPLTYRGWLRSQALLAAANFLAAAVLIHLERGCRHCLARLLTMTMLMLYAVVALAG